MDLKFLYETQDLPNNYKNSCEKYIKRRNNWTTTMMATFKNVRELKKILQTVDNDNKYKCYNQNQELMF